MSSATWFFGVLLFAGVCFAAARYTDVQHWATLAQGARPRWLLLALAAQCSTYLCMAFVWRATLAETGSRLRLRTLFALSIAKLYSDQVLPSGGFSGAAFVVSALTRRGIASSTAFGVLIVTMLGYYAAYLAIDVVALVLLALYQGLRPWTLAIALTFGIVAVIIPVSVLWIRRGAAYPRLLRLLPSRFADLLQAFSKAPDALVRNVRLVSISTLLQTAIFVLDAATLWIMLHAIGQDSSFWIALPSFVLASMVATLGPIPLGLGTFEATSVATLTALGTPIEAALAATLLLRGFTVWLPMVPGLLLTRGALRGDVRAG
jgi:hypothetical protein